MYLDLNENLKMIRNLKYKPKIKNKNEEEEEEFILVQISSKRLNLVE